MEAVDPATEVAREFLDKMGFLVLDDILDHDLHELIKDYLAFLQKHDLLTSYYFLPAAHFSSDDSVLRKKLLLPIAEKLSALLNKKFEATYCFLIHYPGEAELASHVDNERCEWNLGIIVDQTKPVPFYLTSPAGEKFSLPLEVNQAILYRGTKWPHGRETIPAGCFLASVLCHFLEKNE